MATKRILKLTNTEAVIKVDGTAGSVTFSLATDLLGANEVISGTPKVNILAMQVAGKGGGSATLSRDGVELWDFLANAPEMVDLQNFGGVADSTLNTEDITITTSGSNTQLIVKLRKESGYLTRIRPAETGSDIPVV